MRSAAAAVLKPVVAAACELGAPRTRLVRALGIPDGDLDSYDRRVSYEAVREMWRELERWSRDPLIGGRIAQRFSAGGGGLLEYAARSAPTVEQAWKRLVDLRMLVFGDDVQPFEREHDGEYEVGYRIPIHTEPPIPPSEECLVLASVFLFRRIATNWKPIDVAFQHPATAALAAWREFVGCPVRFDAECYGFRLSQRAYRAEIRTHDPHLEGLLHQLARPLTAPAAAPNDDQVAARVVLERLDRGEPVDVDSIAKALHTSRRSLQRQLTASGTSVRKLVDLSRKEIALRELQAGQRTVSEIATLLGFSDATHLARAVRRWTGVAPRRHRGG